MIVADWVNEKELREIAQSLIRIRTTLPAGDEMDCAKYILSLFPEGSISSKMLNHGGNRASLKITVRGKNQKQSLAIVGHMDTVGVSNPESWIHSPFSADFVDRRIYGKGAINVKGGLAAMIASALAIVRSGEIPDRDVHYCFSADEEMNGIGAGALVKSGLMDDVSEIIIVEPTNMGLGLAEKGALWLKVDVKGKKGHSATPDRGVSALEAFMELTNEIKDIFSEEHPHKLLGSSTCTITELNSGTTPNVIPNRATGVIDIRFLPSMDYEKIAHSIGEIAAKMETRTPSLKLGIDEFNVQPAIGMNRNAPMVKRIRGIYSDLGLEYNEIGIHPFTDASRLIPSLGVPFVIVGPGDHERGYQEDEWISLDDICTASELYLGYALGSMRS